MSSYLVYCDGPDVETATCVGVEASGFVVAGAGLEQTALNELLTAIALLFCAAFAIKIVLRVMGIR